MKKTLYIADLRSHCVNGISTGHFFSVAAMYQQLFDNSYDVVVAGGPVYKKRFKDEELLLLPYNICGTSLKDKWHTMKNAIKLFKEAKNQTVVIQQGTVITAFVAIALFYHRTSKLFMIQYSNEGVRSFFKRIIYRFAKKKIDGMICPNDEVGKAYGIPYCVVPDYIYTGTQNFDMDEGKRQYLYDFCMVGRIAEEKGIVEVAKFFAKTKYKIVIAGKTQNTELESKLRLACDGAGNIELHIGYVSDVEYKNYLESSRYTILNYQGEYSRRSSGVVYDTLFAGVPVIGRKCTALEFIEDNKVGFLYHRLQDVSEKELDNLMQNNVVAKYKRNISNYCDIHKVYKQKLLSFMLDSSK